MLTMERRYQVLLLILMGALLFGGGIKYGYLKAEPEKLVLEEGIKEKAESVGFTVDDENNISANLTEDLSSKHLENESEAVLEQIYVYVVGTVQNPGVYKFLPPARLFEAVEKAKPLDEADLVLLNLAQILKDEDWIYVPRVGEFSEEEREEIIAGNNKGNLSMDIKQGLEGKMSFVVGKGTAGASVQGNQVNINRAGVSELDEKLPGIGPALAERIVDYREKNGNFRCIEDIQNVSGIGEKKFAQMKDYLVVE